MGFDSTFKYGNYRDNGFARVTVRAVDDATSCDGDGWMQQHVGHTLHL